MSTTIAPEVLWAQRSSEYDETKNIIYLSINAPELQPNYELDITSNKLTFKDLFGEVDEKKSKESEHLTGKSLILVLYKKELTDEYWPRLTKDKRVNFVKTDFSKWKDQDDQGDEEAGGGGGVEDFDMSSLGGMGGGMPDMGALGGMGGMGGGMPGMGGGMGGMGGMDLEKMMAQMKQSQGSEDDPLASKEGEEEDTDDEMPPLE